MCYLRLHVVSIGDGVMCDNISGRRMMGVAGLAIEVSRATDLNSRGIDFAIRAVTLSVAVVNDAVCRGSMVRRVTVVNCTVSDVVGNGTWEVLLIR